MRVDKVDLHYLPLSPHMKAVVFASLSCPRGEKVENMEKIGEPPCEEDRLVKALLTPSMTLAGAAFDVYGWN